MTAAQATAPNPGDPDNRDPINVPVRSGKMPFRFIFNNMVTVCAAAYLVSRLWQDGAGYYSLIGFLILLNLTRPVAPVYMQIKP